MDDSVAGFHSGSGTCTSNAAWVAGPSRIYFELHESRADQNEILVIRFLFSYTAAVNFLRAFTPKIWFVNNLGDYELQHRKHASRKRGGRTFHPWRHPSR